MSEHASTAIVTPWSKAETHCAVCLRAFAAADEEARHAERECEPERCWCLDFCWVNQGGDCIGDPHLDTADDLGLWLRVRAVEERARDLLDASAGILGTYQVWLKTGDVAAAERLDRFDAAWALLHRLTDASNGRNSDVCPECGGDGWIIDTPDEQLACRHCNGRNSDAE